MEQRWAPRNLPIFLLVPPAFDKHAKILYDHIGKPAVSSKDFWDVFSLLIDAFRNLPDDPSLSEAFEVAEDGSEDRVPLLEGLRDLRYGDGGVGELGYIYYGGLHNPGGDMHGGDMPSTDSEEEEVEQDLREYADFSE